MIPKVWWILGKSFFPQNCAMKTDPPLEIPKRIMFSMKNIWLPRPTAAISTAPSWPTMMVSSILTKVCINCCRVMGTAIKKSFL